MVEEVVHKKKTRNPSVASGATEDSDVESVRRSVRTKKIVSQAAPRGRPPKKKLEKVQEDSEESSQTDKGSTEDLTVPPEKKARRVLKRDGDAPVDAPSQALTPDDPPVPLLPTSTKDMKEIVSVPIAPQVEVQPSVSLKKKESSPAVVPPTAACALPIVQESSPLDTAPGDPTPDYPLRSVVCVPQSGRKKCRWLPALVVHPDSRKKPKIDPTCELRVRLFSNSSYVKVRIPLC